MFRKDRGTRGGGLILYIKNNIRARVNDELTNSEFAESLWCDVEVDHQRVLMGCVTEVRQAQYKMMRSYYR